MSATRPHPSMASIGSGLASLAQSHLDHAFRLVLRGPSVVTLERMIRVVTGEPHPFGNFALVSDSSDVREVADEIAPLTNCGAPAAVLFTGPPADIVQSMLVNAGFGSHGGMPAMAVDIPSLAPSKLPSGYDFARVGPGPEGDEWARAFALGYELPLRVAELFSPNAVEATVAEDAHVQFFAVRKGGRIVGTSVACLSGGVAGIYCVSTVPDERSKGLGGYATAMPLRMAAAIGYRVGVLQSSHSGHSVYRKLGFSDVGEVPLYVRMPT